MRKPYICGNWKLNKTIAEALDFAKLAKAAVGAVKDVEIGIGAPYTCLYALAQELKGTSIQVGAEDCYWEESGAFTGEVSPSLIKDAGCRFVIIGHSERRQFFGETDATVNKKTKAALKAGLQAIVCVGELLAERENSTTNAVINIQLVNGLAGLSADEMKNVVIAYEPVWAIGTGKTATPAQAQEVHAYIRSVLAGIFSKEVADGVRIQYGGSVKPDNVKELMSCPDVDGALVGGAALKADSFEKLVKFNG